MHWYGGSIAEAVTLSKQRNAIFVVFVEGDNEQSTEMTATIEDSAVVQRLADQTNFLAIKLRSGSENYTHFARIYQFVPVPSMFFIGRNGTPLEVVCAGVQPDTLATRIDRILSEHRKEKQPSVQPSTSAQSLKEQTAGLLQAEASSADPEPIPACIISQPRQEEPETSSGPAAKIAKTTHLEITKSGKEYDVVCDGDVCVRRPKVNPDDPGPSQSAPVQAEPVKMDAESSLSAEEKIERAKELIEIKRREKEDKEKELDKQKEMERRATGQGVAELKRWQADQELKQIQEDRKREKMENNLVRQRILEQIAQDRAERRARDAPVPAPAPVAQPSHAPQATSGDGSARARIQFKMPDGTSHTAHFDAEGTLADVQRYVSDNLQLTTSSFSLWTAFPRRELTESDATLRRLELAPSAALLVLPRYVAAATVATPSAYSALIAFVTQLFTSVFLVPTQQVYGWVRARLFPPAAPSGPPRGQSPPAQPRGQTPPAQPRGQTPQPGVRRRGNVHRLPGELGGEDDNNTWNGNSTQQM